MNVFFWWFFLVSVLWNSAYLLTGHWNVGMIGFEYPRILLITLDIVMLAGFWDGAPSFVRRAGR